VRVGTAKRDAMAEEKFISRLTRTLSVSGASPERRDVQAVFAKLKAVERFLNKDDAGFLRAEFISYFSARPIDAAARHEQKIRECVPASSNLHSNASGADSSAVPQIRIAASQQR
jgi:hypothetical protein